MCPQLQSHQGKWQRGPLLTLSCNVRVLQIMAFCKIYDLCHTTGSQPLSRGPSMNFIGFFFNLSLLAKIYIWWRGNHITGTFDISWQYSMVYWHQAQVTCRHLPDGSQCQSLMVNTAALCIAAGVFHSQNDPAELSRYAATKQVSSEAATHAGGSHERFAEYPSSPRHNN